MNGQGSWTPIDPAVAVGRLGFLLTDLDPQHLPVTPRQIAELLWLATIADSRTMLPPAALLQRDSVQIDAASINARSDSGAAPDKRKAPHPELDQVFLARAAGEGDTGPHATRVRLRTPDMIERRRALTRAFRPFKRTVPSVVRQALDEDATASYNAQRRHWLPVLVPAADRWLDVTLVVDAQSECALLWDPVGREFRTVLQQTGAFRNVRLRYLHSAEHGTVGLGSSLMSVEPRFLRSAATALDPTGRTMTLVLTDGVSSAWQSAQLRGVLRRWAESGPTAILQMLPEHAWQRIALAPTAVHFHNPEAGSPNSRLGFNEYSLFPSRPARDDIAVPILEVTPEWLSPWARAIAVGGVFDGQAVILKGMSCADGEAGSVDLGRSELNARDRVVNVDDFRASVPPHVFRLATYLAAAPLNLSVMRTVQATMLPGTPLSDLAEVIFGGLLLRVSSSAEVGVLSQNYDFVPGARERLLGGLRSSEADEVIAAVSSYVERHAPTVGSRFTAAVLDTKGKLTLPASARHWAEVHNVVRRRQGRPIIESAKTELSPLPEPDANRTVVSEESSSSFPTAGAHGLHATVGVPEQSEGTRTNATRAKQDALGPRKGEAVPLYFYLSYAHSVSVAPQDRFERDSLVHRFEEDLSLAVLERVRNPRAIAAGGSAANVSFGTRWQNNVANMLATCRAFVALYSSEYFDSRDCGMEWGVFEDRINNDYVRYNEEREGFIPVLWLPVREESVPSSIRQIQYLHPDLGPDYHRYGLRYLMTHRELRDQYHRAVEFFAKRVISVAESDAPSPADPPPTYQELRNAFAAQGSAESTERPKLRIVVAAPRLGRLPHGCDPEVYGPEPFHWRPYLPDYEGEVAQAAKRLAESLHFFAFIESADHCRELLPTAKATAPTILLVDPWAAQQPDLEQRLRAFDRRPADKSWVRLVVPWNRRNEYSAAHEEDLESRLESTLARTRAWCRWETPRAVDGLETIEDLVTDLPAVIWAAERNYLNVAELGPPSKRPRLRVTGRGFGDRRLAASQEGEESHHDRGEQS